MSSEELAKLSSFRGSLFREHVPLRITARCFGNDLELSDITDMQPVIDGPLGQMLERSDMPVVDMSFSRPTQLLSSDDGGLLLHKDEFGALWIVAFGTDLVATGGALAASGQLWPSTTDRIWRSEDELAFKIHRLLVDGPLALTQALNEPGNCCHIPGLQGPIAVVVDPPTNTLYTAVSFSAEHVPATPRQVALSLACVRSSGTWEPLGDTDDLPPAVTSELNYVLTPGTYFAFRHTP